MKITVLGTGIVGQTIAGKLSELGHEVNMGTRDPQITLRSTEPNRMTGIVFSNWYKNHSSIKLLKFDEAANETDLIINATSGKKTLEVLQLVGEKVLQGKILIDIANPLDFTKGFPIIDPSNTDSLGEQIQRNFPQTKVVKTLNTMNASIMVNPEEVKGNHSVFVSGNKEQAKLLVIDLLKEIGWRANNIIDLGDIKTARGVEMMLPLWLTLYTKFGNANFNFHIQKAD